MSGWHQGIGHHADLPLPVGGASVATSLVAVSPLDRRGIRPPAVQVVPNSGAATGGGDGGAGYDTGGSGSGATSIPGIPGLPPGQYVIVPETTAPHQTFATAQELPDLPFFGIVGTLGPGDPRDLFRLTAGAGSTGVGFGLATDRSDSTIPVELQLFDGSGQVLGTWSLGGQGPASLHADLGSLPAGSTLYFGVAPGSSSGPGGSSAAANYQLWVSLQPATDRATTAAAAVTTASAQAAVPPGTAPLPAAMATATGPTGLPARGDSQAAATAPPDASGGARVAVGSPAIRLARPSGGLLSEGDPAPPAERDFHAVVAQEWAEGSSTEPAARPADEAESPSLAGREKEPDGLVVLQGPGGFRLLGAVAMGHRRRRPAADVGDFDAPPALTGSNPDPGDRLAAQGLPVNPYPPVTEEGVTTQSPAPRARPWGGLPLSVFSGLGVATVFTLNAVFSQPLAGFDYLTSRLDAGGGPRPSPKGRPRRPPARPGGR
jgi:hypothetical protein